jgi:hypothetical protein
MSDIISSKSTQSEPKDSYRGLQLLSALYLRNLLLSFIMLITFFVHARDQTQGLVDAKHTLHF